MTNLANYIARKSSLLTQWGYAADTSLSSIDYTNKGIWSVTNTVENREPRLVYTDSQNSDLDQVVYTFTNVSLGSYQGNKTLVIAVFLLDSGFGTNLISSVSLDGEGTTLAVTVGESRSPTSIYYVPSTSKTTGTISVEAQATADKCVIAVYELHGLANKHPTNTNFSTTAGDTAQSTTLNTEDGGISVALAWKGTSTTGSFTNGITDTYLNLLLGSNRFLSGTDNKTKETVGKIYSVTWGTKTGNGHIVAAHWR